MGTRRPARARCSRAARGGTARPGDRTASLAETLEQVERRRAAWPCSAVLDLLSPELTRIGE
ncbi:MAG: hypothetical protein ACYCO9_10865 [Streptosporangiaceae bacterium]